MIGNLTPHTVDKLIFCALLFLLLPNGARAQTATPTPTPLSEEDQEQVARRDRLAVQAEIAQHQKEIAEAQKATRDAKFPKPDTKPLEGKTEINDNALIESQMVAYVSLARAANKIVQAIKRGDMNNLAIFNEQDMTVLSSYKIAINKSQIIRDGYCQLFDRKTIHDLNFEEVCPLTSNGSRTKAINPLLPAESFLGAFVDLTGLLRTNVQINGQTFDIDEAPLVAEVFRAARRSDGLKDVTLYYPHVMAPNLDPRKKSEILGIMEEINLLRVEAGALLNDIQTKSADRAEAEGDVKGLKKNLKDLNRQKADSKAAAKRLLEAYCHKLANEKLRLPENSGLADDEQEELELLEKLSKGCRGMPPEKRELALELRDTIKGLRAKIAATTSDLDEATNQFNALTQQLMDLLKKLSPDLQSPDALSSAIAKLKGVNDQFDKFIASLLENDSSTGINTLSSYIRAEQLKTAFPEYAIPFDETTAPEKDTTAPQKSQNTFWLQLKVVKAGGNNRIKTNLLWDIFTGGNRVSHSGGVIVEYVLYDAFGRSVASDTITEYTNYIKANRIKDLPDSVVDDCGKEPCPGKKRKD